ncbi:MAG: carotenoid oxygenase family protein [Myxococcus sp.]|nr:carotenoid oxygenase family protein [Myxococcus sp.]
MTASSNPRAQAWNQAMSARPGPLDLTVEASRVEGVIPHALRGGRLLSNGPGWTLIGGRLAHPFDGHGYLRAFEFKRDGSVQLRARFVQTPAFQSEDAAQRLTHRGLGTNLGDHFWQNVLRGTGPRNVANTTVVRWNGQLLAGWEGGAPYAVDAESLETRGEETLSGALAGQATLAHMKHDAALDRLVTCSIAMGRTSTLTFREFDAGGRLLHTRVAPMPGMLFAHDFVITPNWYLLASNPLRMKWGQVARALVGASTLMNAIASDGEAPGAVYLIPRTTQGPVRTATLPGRAFVVHYGNAFERDGAVHLDACLFHDFEFGAEFGFQGPTAPLDPGLPDARAPQRLFRITVPDGATTGTWRQLAPHGVDFPRVHPAHEGRQTPALFGATRADTRYSDPFDSVLRVDLRDVERPPTLWSAGGDVFVGEPIFVPSPEHDEQGHVVVIVSDGLAQRTRLVVLDAANLEAGPVAQVPLPLLPIAFHGTWDAPEQRP